MTDYEDAWFMSARTRSGQGRAALNTWADDLKKTRARLRRMRVPPIPVTAAGYQTNREWPESRIPHVDEPRLPTLNEARNNLTALSQYRNLFFVAYRRCIHVHQPHYPHQYFDASPILVLDAAPSKPHLRGYLNPQQPHAINHVVAADLGTQEILVCTRDDGDVFAYDIDQIHDAVQSAIRSTRDGLGNERSHGVTPFFSRNLGISAWGIAVHKEARMIAFSSNYHVVIVFAFGLAAHAAAGQSATSPAYLSGNSIRQSQGDSDADMSDDGGVSLPDAHGQDQNEAPDDFSDANIDAHEIEHERYHGIIYPDKPHTPALFDSREENFVIRLGRLGGGSVHQHTANIPNIAFCNTSDDPLGRFLISSDIDARNIVWDLRLAQPVRILYRNVSDHYSEGGMDWRRSGWGMLWLDKQMFSHAASIRQATGTEDIVWPGNASREKAFVINTSETLAYIEDNNRAWVENSAAREFANLMAPLEETSPPSTPHAGATATSSAWQAAAQAEPDEIRRSNIIELGNAYSSAFHPRIDDYRSRFRMESPNFWSDYWPITTMAAMHLPSDATELPASPLLLLSMNTMHLFQDADFCRTSPSHPIIYVDKPLEHVVMEQHIDDHLSLFDRLNLFAQIPELGVVVIGSGKGRVAVCTLHQTSFNPLLESSTTRKGKAYGAPEHVNSKPLYTFRVDHLLPFYQQQRDCQRPETWLAGLAVSPLQGGMGEEQGTPSTRTATRRWRLILTYCDFTTLSYEIGEADEGFGAAIMV